MLLILYVLDSLSFATPKSKRVLMGTKVGGEVHGEGQRKRKRASRRVWRVSYPFLRCLRAAREAFFFTYGRQEKELPTNTEREAPFERYRRRATVNKE